MGLIRTIRNLFKRNLTLADFMMSARQRTAGGVLANVERPYSQSPWVYSGARGKARSLCAVPFVIKSGDHTTKTGVVLPPTDPIAKLFSRPSPFYSQSATLEGTSIGLDVDGEAFWLKISKSGGFAGNGEFPAELQLCNATQFRLDKSDIDDETGLVKEWTVDLREGRIKVPGESVIQFALYNPLNPYRGLSPLEAAAQGIQIEHKADAYSMGMLDNNCTPGLDITLKGDVGTETISAFKKEWRDKHQGARKAGEPAVHGDGVEVTPIGFTPQDMAMPQQREWSKQQIAAVLGVTLFEMGSIGEYNRASAMAAKAWLWENTLIPLCHFIEDVLWHRLFRFQGGTRGDVWGEFDTSKVDALREDMTEKSTQAQTLTTIGYTLDEVNERIELGMPTVGDRSAGPAGGIQIGDAPVAAPGAPAGGGGAIVIGDAAPTASGGSIQIKARTRHRALRRPAGARIMRRWHDNATGTLGAVLRKMYRTLRDNALARAVGTSKAIIDPVPLTESELDAILGTRQFWADLARSMIRDPMNAVALSAVRSAGHILGGFDVIELDNPLWLQRAAERTAQMVRTTEAWRARIRARILEAVRTNEGVFDLGEALQEEFGQVIRSNGLVVARTEAGMIGNQIRDDIWKAEGVDQTEWSAAGDSHTRESHAAIDGERRSVGERFSNGLLYPSEPGGPPEEVIQCRCAALPVIS